MKYALRRIVACWSVIVPHDNKAVKSDQMNSEITLTLPETLLHHAQRVASATKRDTATVLADALEMLWPTLDDVPGSQVVSALSDTDVLALADSKMDAVQNQRLAQLQERGKREVLDAAERYELLALLQIYQVGQLRKSEALAEAVHRGLREPMAG